MWGTGRQSTKAFICVIANIHIIINQSKLFTSHIKGSVTAQSVFLKPIEVAVLSEYLRARHFSLGKADFGSWRV